MIKLIDNISIILRDEIVNYQKLSDEIVICAPFVSSNDLLFGLLDSDLRITLICRLTHPLTPDLLEKIYSFVSQKKKVYVYDDNSLHSKVYLFKKEGKPIVAIVGSSNFTESGISVNKEFNICFDSQLDDVNRYIKYLEDNCYEELTEKTIDYYKTFYVKPSNTARYRKAKVKIHYIEEYQTILDKYGVVKGILEQYSKVKLPFTYVFDGFDHYFKTEMVYDFSLSPYEEFKKDELVKYFKIFLSEYFPQEDIKWRSDRYQDNLKLKNGIDTISEDKIRDFVLQLHSVNSGSGSGDRQNKLSVTNVKLMRSLLRFFITEKLDMPQKYALALLPANLHGIKIPYLGPSAIGEIPGWLFPELYPIKNSKLIYIFDFFHV